MKKHFPKFLIFWEGLGIFLRILLAGSIVAGLVLGIVGVFTRSIFTYDQARDALQAYSIWHDQHLKLLGPETDIPGVFHGVLWYYLLAALYGIGKVPEFVVGIFFLLSFGTVIVVGILAHKLFKNSHITVLVVSLYMLSPLFQVTTRWVSNPILPFLVTPVVLLLLWKFFEKQKAWLAFWIGLFLGVIIQGEFAFLLLLIALPLYWIVFRWKLRIKDIVGFCLGLMFTMVSFFIAEIKFKGQAIRGIVQFFHEGEVHHTILQTSIFVWTRFLDLFSITFFPLPGILFGVFFIIFVLCLFLQLQKEYKKQVSFLLVWESMLFVFLFFHVGISTSYFLFYPFLLPTILLVSYVLGAIYKKRYTVWLIFLIILIFQIYRSIFFLQTNTSPLPAQQGTTLSLAKQVVLYTYRQAHGKPFSINTVTNPLFINSTWAYLYMTYGLPKYGYLPYFTGKDQQGRLGFLPERLSATKIQFLIIEPTIGIPEIYITQAIEEENAIATPTTRMYFGRYVVEERLLK